MSCVDVIVPCYNYGRFLDACLQSVLTQQGVSVRVLLIDDASTDDSPAVGKRLADADPRVEFRRHPANCRHIPTFNEGLDWASSDYVVLLSADDLLAPGSLARAAGVMDQHPEVSIVYGRAIQFASDEPLPKPSTTDLHAPATLLPGEQWIERLCADAYNHVMSPEVVVRTRVQKEVGGYLPELPHTGDMEMWMRFAACGQVAIIDADQAYYRIHRDNMHHDMVSSLLNEHAHRWNAFDLFFKRFGTRLKEGHRLRSLAARTVAAQALDMSYDLFRKGHARESIDFLRFAQRVHPPSRRWKIHSRLLWAHRLGPKAWSLLRRVTRRDDAAVSNP